MILEMIIAIAAALGIGTVIMLVMDRTHCNRTEGGYNCHGDNCEGCYYLLAGNVVYLYPQPSNDWGDAPLREWPAGAALRKISRRELKQFFKSVK